MSSVQLLDKTRKIGKLLHNNNSSKVVFNDICSVLREILASNVLVISRKGKVLGVGNLPGAAVHSSNPVTTSARVPSPPLQTTRSICGATLFTTW